MQNYELNAGCHQTFGAEVHGPGDVLPEWYLTGRGINVAALVEAEVLKPTNKRCKDGLVVPEPKSASDPTAAIQAELIRLEHENRDLSQSNKLLSGQHAEMKANLDARDKALGTQTAEIEHLKAACEDHQIARAALETQVAELTAQLDEATKPKAKKADKQPAAS